MEVANNVLNSSLNLHKNERWKSNSLLCFRNLLSKFAFESGNYIYVEITLKMNHLMPRSIYETEKQLRIKALPEKRWLFWLNGTSKMVIYFFPNIKLAISK